MSWFPLHHSIKWRSYYSTGDVLDYQPLTDVLEKQDGVKLATFWRTAPVVNAASKLGEGYYLVQDNEVSYGGYPILDAAIAETYTMPLRKVTTSHWVEKNLPDTTHIGIGLDPFWREKSNGAQRKNHPLACARRQALKGWSELCEVCRYLNREGYTLHTYGLDENIGMLGRVQHHGAKLDREKGARHILSDKAIRNLYSEAACFISCSQHEGFSLTPLEAMATGCPVITTDAGGNMEYCEHGVNCLIGQGPEEIAALTIEILRNKKLAATLAKAALTVPKRYRWDDAVTRLEDILLQ